MTFRIGDRVVVLGTRVPVMTVEFLHGTRAICTWGDETDPIVVRARCFNLSDLETAQASRVPSRDPAGDAV